jgi:hypothetical protein
MAEVLTAEDAEDAEKYERGTGTQPRLLGSSCVRFNFSYVLVTGVVNQTISPMSGSRPKLDHSLAMR